VTVTETTSTSEAPAGVPPPAPAAAGASVAVRIAGVSKRYGTGDGAVLALDHISLDVAHGEFVCLVGASGCGKSTLLSLVAGLDQVTQGTVAVDGRTALMFQDAGLLPWQTALGNVALPMKLKGVRRAERRARAQELLELVRLGEFAEKRPHELSGGMRQRVALARALAQDADVLLMDEPFGALDAITRDVLHDEMERVAAERQLTVLFVTHNVREAARLGDRIILLSSRPGRVAAEFPVAVGRPRRIEAPEVSAIAGEVTTRLREEVRRHAAR
jgi:NitT/TauT family transport system ATP-binding protein